MILVKATHQFQVRTECFKPVATPNVMSRLWMSVRHEELVKSILMQNERR